MSRAALSSAAASSLTTAPTMRTSPPCSTPAPMQILDSKIVVRTYSGFMGRCALGNQIRNCHGRCFACGLEWVGWRCMGMKTQVMVGELGLRHHLGARPALKAMADVQPQP